MPSLQCELETCTTRRGRERVRVDPAETDTHARTHTFIFSRFSPTCFHTPHAPTQHQPNTRRVLGCRETPPCTLGCGHQHHSPGLFPETPTAGPGARACAHTRNNDIGDAMQIAAHVHVHCAMTMCMCIVMCTKLYYHVYWCPLRLEEQRPRVTTSKEFTGAAGA
jgi:hypothetical protein